MMFILHYKNLSKFFYNLLPDIKCKMLHKSKLTELILTVTVGKNPQEFLEILEILSTDGLGWLSSVCWKEDHNTSYQIDLMELTAVPQ